jgi:REP-associated tyrosine transposase
MARPLRPQFAGAVYHLTARGNARQSIFLDDSDRQRFLLLLAREILRRGWICPSYCLMPNHFHLLIETPRANLVRGMQCLNGAFSQGFNRRHDRVGHLFQGRYKSIIVDRDSYYLELCRYIVLNPVRASLVSHAGDWPWSSYRATVGDSRPPQWLRVDLILSRFADDRSHARNAYQKFVSQGIHQSSPLEQVHGQIWLGDRPFLDRMVPKARVTRAEGIPLAQRRPDRPNRQEILATVGRVFDVAPDDVLSRRNQEAFQAAVFLMRRVLDLSAKEIAAAAGVSSPRVSQIQARIESGRCPVKIARLVEAYLDRE